MVEAHETWRRTVHAVLAGAWLALASAAAPALAAPAGADFSAWLSHNTDLPAAQVALIGAESVYSLEPLGSRLPTGEAIVLVRTEALSDDFGAVHGFQSWDANLLVDCVGKRIRVIRSASYLERNRQGIARPEAARPDVIAPNAGEPAAQLLSAACDPDFDWPLRTTLASGSAKAASPQSTPRLAEFRSTPTPTPTASRAIEPQFAVQLARGPSEEGARRAVEKARRALGAGARGLTGATPINWLSGERRRYTALLDGFPAEASARAACEALKRARQDCFVRSDHDTGAPPPPASDAQPDRKVAALPAEAAPATGPPRYLVQIARGPSEDGARRALAKARRTLGGLAHGLTDAMPMSEIPGNRRRFDVRLEGFRSADAAGAACRRLTLAGQGCFARTVSARAG